ncbi:MAG: hypothetical protein QM726_20020 [Chitinophagaceae bacterium]
MRSKKKIDVRIYRFQSFGDNKLIRIYSSKRNSLVLDIYSSPAYTDSLLSHKKFRTKNIDKSIKSLFDKFDPLNLPTLDYEYISSKHMPSVNDGNWYIIETKVEQIFSHQEFLNPEVYSQYYSTELLQAKPFTDFIKGIEKLTGTRIIDMQIPARQQAVDVSSHTLLSVYRLKFMERLF